MANPVKRCVISRFQKRGWNFTCLSAFPQQLPADLMCQFWAVETWQPWHFAMQVTPSPPKTGVLFLPFYLDIYIDEYNYRFRFQMCGWYRSYALKYSKWSDILTESDLLAAKDGKAAKAGLCPLATCDCWVWCPVAKQNAFLWGKRWEQKDTLRKASRERTSLSLQILSNRHGKRTLESLCPLPSLEPTR